MPSKNSPPKKNEDQQKAITSICFYRCLLPRAVRLLLNKTIRNQARRVLGQALDDDCGCTTPAVVDAGAADRTVILRQNIVQ